MDIKYGLIGAIGNTPLIHLDYFSQLTGCEILGKAEFLNPGGSVKDRAAFYLVVSAEESGELTHGGTIVEGTAGNTGIGLTHVCNALGYKTLICMPENQSVEKIDTLKTLGAKIILCPPCPYTDEHNFNHEAKRQAEALDNAVWVNQFDNLANGEVHYETTGPELWQQTNGHIDAFVCATGTGGTISGVSRFLKEQRDSIQVVLADPQGSGLHHYIKQGEVKIEGDDSITEGIGNGRVTKNLDAALIDDAIMIDDDTCLQTLVDLLQHEGLFLGGSSGINVAAAVELARQLGPNHTIVTILCDGGARYQKRLWESDKMQALLKR